MIKASTLPVFRSYINQVDKPEWVCLNDNIMESGLTWGPLITLKNSRTMFYSRVSTFKLHDVAFGGKGWDR